jgi:hypothetical protein
VLCSRRWGWSERELGDLFGFLKRGVRLEGKICYGDFRFSAQILTNKNEADWNPWENTTRFKIVPMRTRWGALRGVIKKRCADARGENASGGHVVSLRCTLLRWWAYPLPGFSELHKIIFRVASFWQCYFLTNQFLFTISFYWALSEKKTLHISKIIFLISQDWLFRPCKMILDTCDVELSCQISSTFLFVFLSNKYIIIWNHILEWRDGNKEKTR